VAAPLTPRANGAYAAAMRLSDRKIESLAEKLVRWMEAQPDVEILTTRQDVLAAIVDEFQREKTVERDLDEEVDRILQQNEARMRQEGVDSWVMRKKIRQQLAREKGIVL
jgi:hypothetical protein